jgi:hypothetical protein
VRPWTEAEHQRLRELYPVRHIGELTRLLARPKSSIKSRATLLGLRKAVGFGAHLEWDFAHDYMLRMYYPHMKTAIIAARVGASVFSTYNRAKKLGLTKTPIYMASPDACRLRREMPVGTRHRFTKGHVPANKGLRRPGWHAGRMKETQFKKGQLNHNCMPLGSTRLIDGYVYVKVAEVRYVPYPVNWKPLHVIEWERLNGELPAGHALAFKDGNRLNTAVENLELISRAELMRRNTVHNLPPELKQVIQLTGALKRKIRTRERKLNGEEHLAGPAQPPVRDPRSPEGRREAYGD